MRIKMQYHIISGRIIETKNCYMSDRGVRQTRGHRLAGASSLKKIAANEREAVKRAARILNTNFFLGFIFVTLKYSNDRLPRTYEEAEKNMARFLRKARAAHMEATGEKLKYFAVTANWSPKHDCKARLHHHLILTPSSLDMLASLWPEGEFYVKRVNNPGNLQPLAEYLLRNVRGLDAGKKKYSTCKGMDKPVITEPKPVDDIESIQPLPHTLIIDAYQMTDDEGRVIGSYMCAMASEPIKVRGGQVLLPRKGSRKKQKPTYELSELTYEDD